MKKINVTIICAGPEEYPGCADLLESCPEINIVACPAGLHTTQLRLALGRSDVLLLDDAVIDRDGFEAVCALHASHPLIRTLLISENISDNRTMAALSLGVQGVMERSKMTSWLRKAIAVLYSGEAWVSRGLVQSLHYQSKYIYGSPFWPVAALTRPDRDTLN
jgi:DNA-binding NarL/FixJ family response regulator